MKLKDVIKNVQPSTVVRLIVLIISLANLVLSIFGTYQLPGLSESEQESLAVLITAIASAVSYWYNNSWSESATAADKIMGMLKNNDVSIDELIDVIDGVRNTIDSNKNSTE